MIFATGGTIAGRGASSTASGVYQAGSIGVAALVDGMFLPELRYRKPPLTVAYLGFRDYNSRPRTLERFQHLRRPDRQCR